MTCKGLECFLVSLLSNVSLSLEKETIILLCLKTSDNTKKVHYNIILSLTNKKTEQKKILSKM